MDQIVKIVQSILDSKNEKMTSLISSNTKLREDLGFDSLDLAELTVRIEDAFNVDIFEDGIVNTVGEIYEKLK